MDIPTRRRVVLLIVIAVMLLLGIQWMQYEEPITITVEGDTQGVIPENGSETTENSISQPEIVPKEIVVHIAGAVKNPGVYTLYEGQRVDDVMQQAGIAENADADALNRAAILTDGQKIVVPFAEGTHIINQQADTAAIQNITNYQSRSATGQININTATVTQLMELPGIGEVKASAIVRYRQEHGAFQAVDQLLQVSGIGNATYNRIADMVCV